MTCWLIWGFITCGRYWYESRGLANAILRLLKACFIGRKHLRAALTRYAFSIGCLDRANASQYAAALHGAPTMETNTTAPCRKLQRESSCWCSVGNVGMNQNGFPFKKPTSWMVYNSQSNLSFPAENQQLYSDILLFKHET